MKESEMINPNALGHYHRDIKLSKIINRWHIKVIMSCDHSKTMSRFHYDKYKNHATLCIKCMAQKEEIKQMTDKITIEMDAEFIKWWKTLAPHVQEDQTMMIVAWWAYEKGKESKKDQ